MHLRDNLPHTLYAGKTNLCASASRGFPKGAQYSPQAVFAARRFVRKIDVNTVICDRFRGTDKMTIVQTLKTATGARTMALDTTTHKIYLLTAQYEPQEQKSDGSRKRPRLVAGTFKILVYGM